MVERDRITSAIKTRARKRYCKFEIKVPKTVACTLEIDQETGTELW